MLVLAALACAGPGEVHLYDGDVDPSRTALVVSEPRPHGHGIREDETQDWNATIIGVDDVALERRKRRVRLLPGRHVVAVHCGDQARWRRADPGPTRYYSRTFVDFESAAGATYEVHCVGTGEAHSHTDLEVRVVRLGATPNEVVARAPGCRSPAEPERVVQQTEHGYFMTRIDCSCADPRCLPDYHPGLGEW